MRRALRVLLVASVVVVGGALPGSARTAPAAAPDTFSVTASAEAISTLSTVPVLLALQAETGVGVSRLKLNNQPFIIADAAPVFVPVLGALQGGGAIAALTACTATFPGDPHTATCGGPGEQAAGVDVAGGSGRAIAEGGDADPAATRGEAAARATGVGTAGIGAGSVASAVRGEVVEGRITGGASTALSDVTIAGLLRITSVHAEISGALGGTPGSGALSTTFDVGGVTLAGIPVAIDEQGLRVDAQGLPAGLVDQLQEQVNRIVEGLGLSIEVAPPRVRELADDGTLLEAVSGGLRVSFDLGGSGAFVHTTLGRAALSMSASRFDALGEPPATSEPAPGADLGPTQEPTVVGGPVPPPAAPVPGEGAPEPPIAPRTLAAVVVDTSDWRDLYLAVVLLLALLPLLTSVRRASWATLKREALRD